MLQPPGLLAALQAGKPSPGILPQLQGDLVAAARFPVGSSQPQLSKGLLQLPDLGTAVGAESGHGPCVVPAQGAFGCPSLPKSPHHPHSPLGDCCRLTSCFTCWSS